MKRSKLNFAWKDSRLRSKLLGYHLTDGWIYRSAVYLLLVAIAYVFLYPLLRMLSMTFMSTSDLINPEIDWVPQNWSFSNLRVAWTVMDMPGNNIQFALVFWNPGFSTDICFGDDRVCFCQVSI
jgi:multiple sugar transport system permease protein